MNSELISKMKRCYEVTVIFLFIQFFSCNEKEAEIFTLFPNNQDSSVGQSKSYQYEFRDCIATNFDYPVGKPDADGYYNALSFTENDHLGDDWNAITGGNSDLGDPVFAVANGYVKYAEHNGYGWGNVIRIDHKLSDGMVIESLYAHCDTMFVRYGEWVRIGDTIGTIGNADGIYFAHLHFEIRDDINMPIGGGYSDYIEGYLDPTEFIDSHR